MKAGKQVKKAEWRLWWWWGGYRSKVSPPSDISCAREAVTTRSAEVQVSVRDDSLTSRSGTPPVFHPDWTFHPSFPPSPCHSSVTHPSPPSAGTLFTLLCDFLHTELQPCHPLVPPPSFLHSPSFSPLKLNITAGFHSAGRADWDSSLWECICLHLTVGHSLKHMRAHAADAPTQVTSSQCFTTKLH